MSRRHAPVPRRAAFLLAGLSLLAGALVYAAAAPAETSVLTKDGTIFEIYSARLGDVVAAEPGYSSRPVLAFRSTRPDGQQATELIVGTEDDAYELPGDIEYEELTGTVFLAYTRFSGIQSDVHFAVRRGTSWREESLVPSIGFYVSLNPRILVTRQSYLDRDPSTGATVRKTRSILHVIWWEDTSVSQARYAAVFIEDGVLALDSVVARDLNALAGITGVTDAWQFPFASYGYPSLHIDAATNGGVRVSFTNLADRTHTVVSITFPDDLTKLTPPPPSGGSAPAPVDPVYARGHTPVGRTVTRADIVRTVETDSAVDTALSVSGVPTFFWNDGNRVRYIRTGSPGGTLPTSLVLRTDLPREKAERLVREMAARD